MFSITPSHIIQYLYCPRFTYFEHVLRIPQFEEKNAKVMIGRRMHEEKSEQNMGYLRKRIGVVKKEINVYLTNSILRGEVDEVLTLQDGTMAPLDYKFAKWEGNLYDTYRTQILCYAWLIEANYGSKVNRGYLVYTRSSNYLLELKIEREDKDIVIQAAMGIGSVISGMQLPAATKVRSRCHHCTYRNICPM